MTAVVDRRLEVILSRRSIASLTEPAPEGAELDGILAAATTVPDHGSLKPWRFVVVRGAGRVAFGEALAAAAAHHVADLPEAAQEKLRKKAFLAPLLVAVIASPQPSPKVPEWEQVASASCCGYAIALAAHALGFGAVWKSANYLSGPSLTDVFGLADTERLLGWVAIGTPVKDDPRPPNEPVAAPHAAILDGPALRPYSG
ncbi:MAG TPA: nitroreductase [Mycobacteriales bacterium]|nr:nitroreductase [Mycobacteriales bacterium]